MWVDHDYWLLLDVLDDFAPTWNSEIVSLVSCQVGLLSGAVKWIQSTSPCWFNPQAPCSHESVNECHGAVWHTQGWDVAIQSSPRHSPHCPGSAELEAAKRKKSRAPRWHCPRHSLIWDCRLSEMSFCCLTIHTCHLALPMKSTAWYYVM